MRTKMFVKLAPALLLAGVIFAAVPGVASAISDTLTVFNPNGSINSQISAFEGQEGNGTSIFLIGNPFLADPAQFGKATTLCEVAGCNATSPPSSFSDIFGVVQATIGGTNFYFLAFTSDGENGTAFGNQGATFLLEVPGFPYSATQYLLPGLIAQGYTATFVSDGEVVTPEPGTLVLLGSGLIGLAGFARRRMSR
jgi:hypothetical protein